MPRDSEAGRPRLDRTLVRRGLAEFLGTAMVLAAIVGSGIAINRLAPQEPGLQVIVNAVITGAAFVATILALGPVSGGHFNPVVTVVDRLLGGVSTLTATVYVTAQILGAIVGTIVADIMFSAAPLAISSVPRTGLHLWVSEIVAAFGLIVVILGVARSKRVSAAPYAVGTYIGAAFLFTASTCFANPAVTIGRIFTDQGPGISPSSALPYVIAQFVGGLAAMLVARFLFPDVERAAASTVVPKEGIVVPAVDPR